MMNLFTTYKKYNQSNIWIEQFKVREDKKQYVQSIVLSQVHDKENSVVYSAAEQVVFTRADIGHNREETEKIQQIYHELEDAPVIPVYAFA